LVPKPNTPCRLQTVDRLETVNLLVNPNGSVRSKRGLMGFALRTVLQPA
jgi:hypothetical protein